jgi:hypothetical protein
MVHKKTHKSNNRKNKVNDIGRPEGKLNNKKLPPTYENFDGEPIQ